MKIRTMLRWALAISLLGVLSQVAEAQTKITRRIEGDGFFMIQETGAMILQSKDTLKVGMIPPTDARPKEYANVDLQQGDIVLMVNGKRVKTAKEMEEIFKALKPGKEVSLGIKRDSGLRMVKFPRADESKLPKRQMMIMKQGGEDGEGGDQVQIQTKDGTREFTGKGARLLGSLGLVVAMKDSTIVVLGVVPTAAEKSNGREVKEGDIIAAANGKKYANTDDLTTMIDELPDGTKVELTMNRDGKPFAVTFTKATEPGRRVIKKSN